MNDLVRRLSALGVTVQALMAYALAVTVIVVDQISKTLALHAFMRHCPGLSGHAPSGGQPWAECVVPVLPIFRLTLVWNGGMSFGLLRTGADLSRWGLTIFAIVIAGVLAWWVRSSDKRLFALSIGFLMGGALGNVIDRFRFGSVVDFLDFNGLAAGHFPWIFNVADSAITVGAVLLLTEIFLPSFQSWLASRRESGN